MRSSPLVVSIAVLLSLALPRGSAAADGAASALPPPPPSETNIDELLAVVEGEAITRRSLIREIGERGPDQDEREYEFHLRAALMRRATNRVFVKAGEREGLSVTPDRIDDYVKKEQQKLVDVARQQAEKIEKGSGAKITFERILKEDLRVTFEEYRGEKAKELMLHQYFYVLFYGVPGKRAIVDLEASPEDVRRLYAAHRSKLDERAGVRYAIFVLKPFDAPEAANLSYDQAMTAAKKKAATLLADFHRDQDPDRVAKVYGLKRNEYSSAPPGEFKEEAQVRAKDLSEWLFASGRRAGESTVVFPPSGEIVALEVLEVRPARILSFAEVQDAIIDRIRAVRQQRFQQQHTLDLLSRAQIWPTSLADDLVDQARGRLKKLDEDDVNKDIRLR